MTNDLVIVSISLSKSSVLGVYCQDAPGRRKRGLKEVEDYQKFGGPGWSTASGRELFGESARGSDFEWMGSTYSITIYGGFLVDF